MLASTRSLACLHVWYSAWTASFTLSNRRRSFSRETYHFKLLFDNGAPVVGLLHQNQWHSMVILLTVFFKWWPLQFFLPLDAWMICTSINRSCYRLAVIHFVAKFSSPLKTRDKNSESRMLVWISYSAPKRLIPFLYFVQDRKHP